MPDPTPIQAVKAAADRGVVFPIGLGLTAGFADAFGYLTLHGLLTAHITGNLAFMAIGIAQGSPHIIMKFLALPLFMLGASLATIFITRASRHRHLALAWSLLLEAGLFACCALAGALLPPSRSPDDLTSFCLGTILIMAMALQNAVMRIPLQKLPSTTAMTTNVTEAMVQWTRWLTGFGHRLSPEEKQALFGRAKTIGMTVSAFAVGAVGGGLSALRIGDPGLLAPMLLLLVLAARAAALHKGEVPTPAYEPKAPDSIKEVAKDAANSAESKE